MFRRTKDATTEVVKLGDSRAVDLSKKLEKVYFRRTKEVLQGVLPKKEEHIIFCELSDLQKDLYKYILGQPDFTFLRNYNAPCDCSVNRKVRKIKYC